MADTSTKDTSASIKATPVGKVGSKNMPLGTDANTHMPTLQNIAESLVALELDLTEATKNGYRWQSVPLKSKAGAVMLAVVIYHPKHSIEAVKQPSGTVLTLDGVPASVVATRKKADKNA